MLSTTDHMRVGKLGVDNPFGLTHTHIASRALRDASDEERKEPHVTTTTQNTPRISEVLRERRKETGASKRSIYRRLGVSSQTYDAWEIGLYVPSDDYAEILADYLGIELRDVVWMLYRSRTYAKEGSVR